MSLDIMSRQKHHAGKATVYAASYLRLSCWHELRHGMPSGPAVQQLFNFAPGKISRPTGRPFFMPLNKFPNLLP